MRPAASRIPEGKMLPIRNAQLAARMVLETIALWAIHRPWDASPRPFADDEVQNAVIDMLVHAYLGSCAPAAPVRP